MKNIINLEFNDRSTAQYKCGEGPLFTKPFGRVAFQKATEMLYMALSKVQGKTFADINKINDQQIYHQCDMVGTFYNMPIFNELAAMSVIEACVVGDNEQ